MWAAKHRQKTGKGLTGRRAAFTFTASPWDLTVTDEGEVLPCIGMVSHEKGLDGVKSTGPGVDDVDEDNAVDNAKKSGRIPIPHEIEVVAFGVKRVGYMGDQDMRPQHGSEGQYWLDAWTRVDWLHGRPVFRTDPDGWQDFHRRVLDFICPQGLTDDLITAAETRTGLRAGPNGKARKAKPQARKAKPQARKAANPES